MNRNDLVNLAENAVWSGTNETEAGELDAGIRHFAALTGRSVEQTADLLRTEAFAGGHYRGETFDQAATA